MGSLQAHEARLNRSQDKNEEKVFQVKGEASKNDESVGRGHGRGSFRGRGRGRSRGRGCSNWQERQSQVEEKGNKNGARCYNCKKFGHVKANCRNQASYVEEESQESKLFMAHLYTNKVSHDAWFVDSGCSNHMTGNRLLFKELDESQKLQVRLGDNKQMQVEGRGIVTVETSNGKVKLLSDVFFVPNLAHNLLSVGQLMDGGYAIVFDNGACVIKDKFGQPMVNICMTENKMFPLKISNMKNKLWLSAGRMNQRCGICDMDISISKDYSY